MCTVTLIPRHSNDVIAPVLRMAINRDESRDRPLAAPPVVLGFGPLRAILPLDRPDTPQPGTWVAVNDAGIAMTLLNRNLTDMRGRAFPGKTSRGRIIPELLHLRSLDQIAAAVPHIDPDAYPPFQLLVSDGQTWLHAIAHHSELIVKRAPLERPTMWTSSSLGDHLVEAPRQKLFDRMLDTTPEAWPAQQDAFHRHRWLDRPQLSVCMSRDDAQTVSLTLVEIFAASVAMTYLDGPPDQPGQPVTRTLRRLAGATP